MHEIQNGESALKEEHRFLVREMKEQMCHVAFEYDVESKGSGRDDPLNQEQR